MSRICLAHLLEITFSVTSDSILTLLLVDLLIILTTGFSKYEYSSLLSGIT